MSTVPDTDTQETGEWLEALDDVLRADGPERARALLETLLDHARHQGAPVISGLNTPYVNTLDAANDPPADDTAALEQRLRSFVRWNAIMLVLRANAESSELGGHIASYQSAATLYEEGFNHFWHAPSEDHGGDLVFMQGHSSPGLYARSFLEGRLTRSSWPLPHGGRGGGLSSYPHPWLMPDFWQFPTVSMGLGPLMAIYQARFMKYLKGREITDTATARSGRSWATARWTSPSRWARSPSRAARSSTTSSSSSTATCSAWTAPSAATARSSRSSRRTSAARAGTSSRSSGARAGTAPGGRQGRHPHAPHGGGRGRRLPGLQVPRRRLRARALLRHVARAGRDGEDWTDDEIWALNRGGHDALKVGAAYAAAASHKGQPTVILAKTVKGYGMGESGEGQNITHQQKKMGEDALKAFRTRFNLDLTDEQVHEKAFVARPRTRPRCATCRSAARSSGATCPPAPTAAARSRCRGSTRSRPSRAAAASARTRRRWRSSGCSRRSCATRRSGKRIVPIVADESRTFGMEGMFRQLGIFSQVGQLYQPEDADQLMYYKEDKKGQILQEGINEAGAMSSWIAAATSYANHGEPMIPSTSTTRCSASSAWATCVGGGDSRSRGFLIGGTAGRTTLNGEGLQHEDGHSHVWAGGDPELHLLRPRLRLRDRGHRPGRPAAHVRRAGGRLLLPDGDERELRAAPMPEGAEEGILRGMHQIAGDGSGDLQLLGSGTILREVLAGAELLREDFGVTSTCGASPRSPSWPGRQRVRARRAPAPDRRGPAGLRDALPRRSPDGRRHGLHPRLRRADPPVDPRGRYEVLGTDGYGRSDYRVALRRFFEVDRFHVVVAALFALGRAEDAAKAIAQYEIDTEGAPPWRR
jgi:pyruvate dehydrogenase E1 component